MTLAEAGLGGFILGFAGSFHCACMCGGIASGALLIANPKTFPERLAVLFTLQAGRVAFYALAGAIFSGLAGLTIGPGTTAGTYKILQWASAAVLMWFGLAMAGLLPQFALPSAPAAISGATRRLAGPGSRLAPVMPAVAGFFWGMTPCPMVYAALVPATLTGTMAGGAAWMAGFGLGTIPAVTGAALGVSALSRVRRWRYAEMTAGLAIAAFGLFSITNPLPKLAALCGF
jgi:sulfite exporter TauE/SafE